MPIHNKLVRDKIPEIIENTGKTAYCHILTEECEECQLSY